MKSFKRGFYILRQSTAMRKGYRKIYLKYNLVFLTGKEYSVGRRRARCGCSVGGLGRRRGAALAGGAAAPAPRRLAAHALQRGRGGYQVRHPFLIIDSH